MLEFVAFGSEEDHLFLWRNIQTLIISFMFIYNTITVPSISVNIQRNKGLKNQMLGVLSNICYYFVDITKCDV